MLGPGRPESPRRSAERKRCATRESGDRGWGAGGRVCQVFSRGSLPSALWPGAEGSGHSRRT